MVKKRRKKEYLAHFNLAGFNYYDGAEAFPRLRVGQKLEIELEPDNRYDPMAVMVWFEDSHLGYIPKRENVIICKLLRMGLNNIELRIQRIDPQAHPEEQVWLVAHLVEAS